MANRVNNTVELLAPGGDMDSIKAAILAGANAVYCGLDRFNARNRAANITLTQLPAVVQLAHARGCAVFITLNILIVEREMSAVVALLKRLHAIPIDGVIVQDWGVAAILRNCFADMPVHASTQMTTHNTGQVALLHQMGITRVNLCREMNLSEIANLTQSAHAMGMATEVFVHGALCLSFSGICYMSSVISGNSGNRGRCSQPCRERYDTTPAGKNYPLNLKDNSVFHDLPALIAAGVDSLKIEGRMKNYDYVHVVVDTWRKRIDGWHVTPPFNDNSPLFKVFNRDFTNGFLSGTPGRAMFIDNPRDHSLQHLEQCSQYTSHEEKEKARKAFFDAKDAMKHALKTKLDEVRLDFPLLITLSGTCGTPLKVVMTLPDVTYEVSSQVPLSNHGRESLSYDVVMRRFRALNDTACHISGLHFEGEVQTSYLPFSELTRLKNRMITLVNGGFARSEPLKVPVLPRSVPRLSTPRLMVLVQSPEHCEALAHRDVVVCYQLPDSIGEELDRLIALFQQYPQVIPWFPSIIMERDFEVAVSLLQRARPAKIITNNSGIAYAAFEADIAWLAGPSLNLVNGYGLHFLKEEWGCSGAFISNEISRYQISQITPPNDFDLCYSIYHPIELLTSRQCLFQQVTGCEKPVMDSYCMPLCNRRAMIQSGDQVRVVEKSKGCYHRLYHAEHYLNTDIVSHRPLQFSGYLIHWSSVVTQTVVEEERDVLLNYFKALLRGDANAAEFLQRNIHPTTHEQYQRGI